MFLLCQEFEECPKIKKKGHFLKIETRSNTLHPISCQCQIVHISSKDNPNFLTSLYHKAKGTHQLYHCRNLSKYSLSYVSQRCHVLLAVIIPILDEERWSWLFAHTHPQITWYRRSFNSCLYGRKTLIKRTKISHFTVKCTSPPLICYYNISSHIKFLLINRLFQAN